MKISIKYFGLIVDITKVNEELLEVNFESITVSAFKEMIVQKYPQLAEIVYYFALNETIASDESIIQHNDTLALLPPFAGG